MANSSGIVQPGQERPGRVGQIRITPDARLEWPGHTLQLSLFIGSRRMGRSFAFSRQGHLYQAPVGFYANRQSWDFAPGYEHDRKPDFTRPITAECLFCHSTEATPEAGQVNRYSTIAHGIGCARCHGTGESHDALIRPRKLPPRLRDSVCEQCHLSGTVRLAKADKLVSQFKPGQNLADYIEVFTGDVSQGVRVNGHSDSLAASRCKQASGDKLWCGACHNPHQATNYNAVCQSCHQQPHNKGDCTSCHMKKARASDGGHTVFTDHSIALHPAAPTPLRSYFGRTPSPRDLGLAYVQLAARHRDATYVEKAWPLLRAASQSNDPPLLNAIAAILTAEGQIDKAIAAYRLSLRQDPAQPETLNRLAALLGRTPEAQQLRLKATQLLP